MSDLPSSPNKVQLESVQFRGPVSEAAIQEIGALANYLKDEDIARIADIAALAGVVGNTFKLVSIENSLHHVVGSAVNTIFTCPAGQYAIFMVQADITGTASWILIHQSAAFSTFQSQINAGVYGENKTEAVVLQPGDLIVAQVDNIFTGGTGNFRLMGLIFSLNP